MKKIFVILALFVVSLGVNAQNAKFEAAILKGKLMLSNADTSTSYVAAANYFERIAQSEKKEWLPLYYQAYAYSQFGIMDGVSKAERESMLNKALEITKQLDAFDKNAEILALKGYVQMLRLSLDPMTYGQTLSPIIYGYYKEALALESENPRALLFMGQMQYGSAQFFGTETDQACGLITQANQIFEAKTSDEPSIYPTWGQGGAKYYLTKCGK